MRHRSFLRAAALCGTAAVAACSSAGDSSRDSGSPAAAKSAATSAGAALTGAGATFPTPIYSKWFSDYAASTGVHINYQPLGSGAGIRQLQEQTVDFGASDAPMSDSEMAHAKGGAVLHVPTVIGAVVVTYNLPSVSTSLRLTGSLVAEIFLGRVTRWNDTRIAALNPGISLPATNILVVHRSDGSGTSYIFTDFLSVVSPTWNSSPGRGKDVQWPTGLGGKGNDGVSGLVKQTPGSIGYVELAYAVQNHLPAALIQNAAGRFVAPSVESATAAAAGVVRSLPANTDYRIAIVNAPGDGAYPISSFTWLLLYTHQTNAAKGRAIVDFVHWALHDGEKSAASLAYAPLPPALVGRLDSALARIQIGGA
jgi:phosphate transport system substrate-binding protein